MTRAYALAPSLTALALAVGLALAIPRVRAQQIPLEVLLGHEAVNTQLIVSRPLRPESKFGAFALVNFNLPYDRDDRVANYYIIQALGTYQVTKHVRIIGGAFAKTIDYGPSAGAQAIFRLERGIILVSNRYELVEDFRGELLALFELRPHLTEALTGYLRVQVLAETDFTQYERGFQTLRAGLTSGPFQFGVGATFDQFGPAPITRANVGVFGAVEL